MLPSLGLTIPQMMPISVVFPAPLGPSSAKISPRRMPRLMFLSARRPEAYVLERFVTEMTVCMEFGIEDGARSKGPARRRTQRRRLDCLPKPPRFLPCGPPPGLGLPGVFGAFRRAPCSGLSGRLPEARLFSYL